MTPAVIARLAVVACVALGVGCFRPTPPLPAVEIPAPVIPDEPPWPATLVAVRSAADSGRFATADSMLAAFEQAYAGTPHSDESAFWRALLRADPRNPAFASADARAALDGYLARPDAERRVEARVLRRMLGSIDSLRTANANLRAAGEFRERSREEEAQRLRDELQRTQAELDRIKRRLGSPKP